MRLVELTRIGMVMLWTIEARAPWQTPQWRERMRRNCRRIAYQRLIENRWVSAESLFIEAARLRNRAARRLPTRGRLRSATFVDLGRCGAHVIFP
jgi:hypothetical protein